MTESVHVEQLVARPREVVWEAIATPDGIARWWGAGDVRPEVGHRFTVDMGPWGQRPCRVLEAEPLQTLVYTLDEGGMDWTLTWRLVDEGTGTRLVLDHAGFDLSDPKHRFSHQNMGLAWGTTVLPHLPEQLAAATAE